MKFYHGSPNRNIREFKIVNRASGLDFGEGLYLTTNKEQAIEWSCHSSDSGAVYEFDIDVSDMKVLELDDTEDFYYVMYLCRIELEDIAKDEIDGFSDADMISGCMVKLPGRFKMNAEEFNKGDIDLETFKKKTRLHDSDMNQIVVKSEKAICEVNNALVKKYLTKKSEKGIIIEQSDMP